MTMTKPVKHSAIALATLTMLYEEPMHPYRMQQLIKERGKDEVINVTQRTSLYQTINRLEREGLVAAQGVSRDENRPERTVYELTPAGHQTMVEWMRKILSTPSPEFPEFPAAISVLAVLTPKDARQQLERRIVALEAELKRIEGLQAQASFLPRLFLLEMELLRATCATELKWVRSVVEDIRSGKLTWSEKWLRKMAREFSQQHDPKQPTK
jgi:DNA-binding PadR family transcriptional regulator